MQQTRNTLSETIRERSIEVLNKHLAAAIDLHAQIKQAHWNVRGPNFIAIHELFDKIAEDAEDYSDLIAERAAQLGGTAQGTVQVAVKNSPLVPYALGIADQKQHLFAVAGALAAFGQLARDAIAATAEHGDAATSDIFTEVVRGIDYHLWQVESHLHG